MCVCVRCVFEGRVSQRDVVKRQKDVFRESGKDKGKFQDGDEIIVDRKSGRKDEK